MAASRKRAFAFVLLLFCTYLVLFIGRIDCRSTLIQMDDDNWNQMLTGQWMVEFYAPWCPACKGLQKIWEEFSTWGDDLEVKVAQVDVTVNQGLSGRFMVTALPTIYHVIDGHFRQYRGSRDKEELITFVEEKKWRNVEEVSWFWRPNTIQMSLVSYFYKLSMILRSVHNLLVEGYGIPNWASLVLFGLATILIGALLGLFLVCIVDFIYPPIPRGVAAVPSPIRTESTESDAERSPNASKDTDSAGSESPKSSKGKEAAENNSTPESPSVRQLRKRNPVVNEEQ